MEILCNPNLDTMSYPVGANMSDNLRKIKEMANVIDRHFPHQSINLWCMGSSGAIIAGIISAELIAKGYPMPMVCHVKKEGEESHSSSAPYISYGTNILVDDFIRSGSTVQKIYDGYSRRTGGDCLNAIVVTCNVDKHQLERLRVKASLLVCFSEY